MGFGCLVGSRSMELGQIEEWIWWSFEFVWCRIVGDWPIHINYLIPPSPNFIYRIPTSHREERTNLSAIISQSKIGKIMWQIFLIFDWISDSSQNNLLPSIPRRIKPAAGGRPFFNLSIHFGLISDSSLGHQSNKFALPKGKWRAWRRGDWLHHPI